MNHFFVIGFTLARGEELSNIFGHDFSNELYLCPRAYLCFYEMLFNFADMIPAANMHANNILERAVSFNPSQVVVKNQTMALKVDALLACNQARRALEMMNKFMTFQIKVPKVKNAVRNQFQGYFRDYWRSEESPILQSLCT